MKAEDYKHGTATMAFEVANVGHVEFAVSADLLKQANKDAGLREIIADDVKSTVKRMLERGPWDD